jgi:hypothetical protein
MERVTGPKRKPGPVHYPYVRPLQLEWQDLPTGFRAGSNDPYRFEVICAACGDIDGPVEYQPLAAQQIRGPYEAKRIAQKIAQRHQVGSTYAASRSRSGKRDQLKYMLPLFPIKTTPDRSHYAAPPFGEREDRRDRSSRASWHQLLWVRMQATWIRWRK